MGLRLFLAAVIVVSSQTVRPSPDRQLTAEIEQADRAMFDAFNRRDLDGMMAMFADDLEFYHDKDGRLTFSDVRAGFDRMFKTPEAPTRQLVPDSMRVYPIPQFGAIEIGAHRFCHIEKGKEECGVFDFTIVWRKQANRWQATRAVSYGH